MDEAALDEAIAEVERVNAQLRAQLEARNAADELLMVNDGLAVAESDGTH